MPGSGGQWGRQRAGHRAQAGLQSKSAKHGVRSRFCPDTLSQLSPVFLSGSDSRGAEAGSGGGQTSTGILALPIAWQGTDAFPGNADGYSQGASQTVLELVRQNRSEQHRQAEGSL